MTLNLWMEGIYAETAGKKKGKITSELESGDLDFKSSVLKKV